MKYLSKRVSGRMQNSSTPWIEYLLLRLMLSSNICRYSEVFEMRCVITLSEKEREKNKIIKISCADKIEAHTNTYCSSSIDKSRISVDRERRLQACIRKNGMMNFSPQPTSFPSCTSNSANWSATRFLCRTDALVQCWSSAVMLFL